MDPTDAYLDAWELTADGPPTVTPTSTISFVHRADGTAAVLKIAPIPEELRGGALMAWWDGTASARVLEHLGPAVLLERAQGPRSLVELARRDDDAAARVLAKTAQRLHSAPDDKVRLMPLRRWFTDLLETSDQRYADARDTALRLLDDPVDEVVLHGDIHHGNVLDFGDEATPVWKAIDPKALLGESGFDYANLLCNPTATATANHEPARLARRVRVVAAVTGTPAERIRDWHTAWHALGMLWTGSGR